MGEGSGKGRVAPVVGRRSSAGAGNLCDEIEGDVLCTFPFDRGE